ncbi:MAG: hypothetical protein PW845_12830 [Pseudomonas sp.]|uniref:hypothetical protein n=1 Tax=Pseudomonas abieticivorans TaxID=2931382 RepID=UPI0020BEBFF7|nr:hypothetical protein [Pseudomonas sp. PIA16]MDE1166246.1 hypothetical protein [Pseudomonas sp.]
MTPLYLPLAEDTATALAQGLDTDAFFATATVAPLAAVLLIQSLAALVKKNASVDALEIRLADVIRLKAGSGFADQVRQHFDGVAFSQGLTLMGKAHLAFSGEHDYLTDEGLWDFTFRQRQAERSGPPRREFVAANGSVLALNDGQNRVFDEFRSNPEESFHVQGYAGTGKTFLINGFLGFINPKTTLLLTQTKVQADALDARTADSGMTTLLFAGLADRLLNRDLTSQGWRIQQRNRTSSNWQVTDEQIALWLGLQAVGLFRPREVARLCRRTVSRYCHGVDRELSAKHLPIAARGLSDLDSRVAVEYSRLLWQEMIRPSAPEIELPVRGYHRIKYLALLDEVIPEAFTHVIVDESHELTAPMIQILDRSPQAVITLGDEFQHLQGMTRPHGPFVRQRHVTRSLRAGAPMGEVLNPMIQAHPSRLKDAYEGSAEHGTDVQLYGTTSIPQTPTTILVDDEWGLFLWFDRLTRAGASFVLLDGAERDFHAFVSDVIELYFAGTRPRHKMIFRYGSWDALASAMGGSYAFKAASALLEKGFDHAQFAEDNARYMKQAKAKIKLGRASDAKNMEFDSVLVSRDLMRPPRAGNVEDVASRCSKLYTASSRARHQIIVPGNMGDWLQDIGKTLRR